LEIEDEGRRPSGLPKFLKPVLLFESHPKSAQGKNLDNIQLTILIKIEPNTAPQKPLT
jgi:hypothetical protein